MEFFYQDKGNYFRGLLVLIGKDNIIGNEEKAKILEITNRLGFDPKFCNDAVNEFLENSYVDTNPPVFSSKIIAKSFLEEAINLSLIDNDFHIEELEWLQNVAKCNDITSDWLNEKIQQEAEKIESKEIITFEK
jgi:hypothetical protein